MLRHGCGRALANAGHDTRALQAWLGHKNIQHTVRYTELAPDRFKNFWRDPRQSRRVDAGQIGKIDLALTAFARQHSHHPPHRDAQPVRSPVAQRLPGRSVRARREGSSFSLENLLRGTNWLLGSGFSRIRRGLR
jgi:hypothetical protein